MPSHAPLSIAFHERRVEATYIPDSATIELLISSMVSPRHRTIRPVELYLEEQCYEITEASATSNTMLLTGEGIHARMKVWDACPEHDHQCKADRLTVIEEVERKVWEQ